MTPERAREVIASQSAWPFWGAYEKFMTTAEIAHCRELFKIDPWGGITFSAIVHRIAKQESK